MAIQIICINKAGGDHQNPHEAVSSYGWVEDDTGKSDVTDRPTVVGWVENGVEAYVRDNQGKVGCYVNVSLFGTKFLQTRADGQWANNLLSLGECKIPQY